MGHHKGNRVTLCVLDLILAKDKSFRHGVLCLSHTEVDDEMLIILKAHAQQSEYLFLV